MESDNAGKGEAQASKAPIQITSKTLWSSEFDSPFHGAVVRFHKIRPNNDWLGADLEAYKLEGVLTIDWTNPVG